MIYTREMILELTKDYKSPHSKLTHMIKKEEIIRVRRGLYSDTKNTPGEAFAPLVYSPSYLSFQYALAFHGLIPEAVFNYTCAGFGLESNRIFKTPFGVYVYKYIPENVFYIETQLIEEQGYSIKIANPEKALCDIVYKLHYANTQRDVEKYLFKDLRIEPQSLTGLRLAVFEDLAPLYKRKTVKLLKNIVKKVINGKHDYF
jgi:predicted transcriptional regulator of viral defense system